MPLVVVNSGTLPEAWEKSIVETWYKGIIIDTEYNERSKDVSIIIKVEDPLKEPRVHLKGIIAGRLSGLFEYVDEVLKGIHDDKVEEYGYTYHERLFRYTVIEGRPLLSSLPEFLRPFVLAEAENPVTGIRMVFFKRVIDQIQYIIDKLKKAPYSRRAQAITWQPWKDIHTDHPPCLQRIWCRVIDGKLAMHVHMRSNDAMKASFMNMFAFTELQKYIAEKLGVDVGYYMHIADSYHIYESDWKWAEKFVEQIETGKSKKYWMSAEALKKRCR